MCGKDVGALKAQKASLCVQSAAHRIKFAITEHNNHMIKPTLNVNQVRHAVEGCYLKPVTVKLSLGRNKFITFPATISGVYPSLFTVRPEDKNFLGKTAYSYSEVLCGRVRLKAR